MAKDSKIGVFWKLLFGTVTCLSFALPVLSDWSKMAKTTCPDGFGLNYTLPMSQKCEMKRLQDGTMVQSIPKLIPFPSVIGGCHQRKSKEGIPGGHRICSIPDCGKKLCQNGWCEETMVGYNCHCSSGFQGRHFDEQSTESSTTDATTKPTVTTSRKTTMSDITTSQETTTTTIKSTEPPTTDATTKPGTSPTSTMSDITTSQETTTSKSTELSTTDVTIKPTTTPTATMSDTTTYEETTTATKPACHDDPIGVNYRGNLSRTISGHTCQAWTSQYPHGHTNTPADFPNAGLDNNYCRNPDVEYTAWCYTTNLGIRWEYCAVGYLDPRCQATPACKEDPTGVHYRGNLSRTVRGHTCQAWTSQDPHEHAKTPADFPNAGLDNNYCRNPDMEFTAWCYTTNPETRWDFCAVGYLDPRCQVTPACQEDPTGVHYRGNLSRTISGHTCQTWTSQDPHEHTNTPADFPNAGLDENYCRNPDIENTAWCYTTDPETRWEYCAVGYLDPRCQE